MEHLLGGLWPWNLLALLYLILMIVMGWPESKETRLKRAMNFKPENSLGDAKLAEEKSLKAAGLFGGKGVPIGYSPKGRALHYPGLGHLLTVAPTRSGKGATLLVNCLLSLRDGQSCIIIDPKCENALVTAHFRKRLGKVYLLNPFKMFPGELRGMQARFNPMDILDADSPSFHVDCDKLATALVWEESLRESSHWTTSARILVSGVIAALVRHAAPEKRNLVEVAQVVSNGHVISFCRRMMATKDPFIVQKLGRFTGSKAEESKEIDGVISTAVTQLGFIGNASIAESLSKSDFRFGDLKRKTATVYICLPLSKLDVTDKYFRLILETALTDLLNETQRGKRNRTLVIVDEMAQLGNHIKILENCMGMAAGAAGVQMWGILQTIDQLMGMFPKTWQTFIGNCGVTMWFSARDNETRGVVSQLAGATEVLARSRNVSTDRTTGEPVVSENAQQHGRPLILPHEVGTIAPDEMIAFVEGRLTVRAKRKPYYKLSEFRGKYRDNPYVR